MNFVSTFILSIRDVETLIITKNDANLLTGTISKEFDIFLSPTICYTLYAVAFSYPSYLNKN